MQAQKRSWIYEGLGHRPGVALARPVEAARVPVGGRVLLGGDRHVVGLAPALGQLCGDRSVELVELVSDSAEAPRIAAEMAPSIDRWRPQIVIVTGGVGRPHDLRRAASALALVTRSVGGTIVWLRPPAPPEQAAVVRSAVEAVRVPTFHSEHLGLPLGPDGETPSASGYAGWAGALWRWLR